MVAEPAPSRARCNPSHVWLAAVLPAGARRFRVADARLAATLFDAGAELVESAPDVELAGSSGLRGDATWGAVSLEAPKPEGPRLRRGLARASRLLTSRAATALARRSVGRRYSPVAVIRWELGEVVRVPEFAETRPPRALAERLPLNTVVVGGPARRPTALEEARSAASAQAGISLELAQPVARRSGVLLALGAEAVLRVALGPARTLLELEQSVLDRLQAADPGATVATRLPSLLARGRVGLADWSLQGRMAGSLPPPGLSPRIRADCLEFLTALHKVGNGDKGTARALVQCAEIVARVCTPERAQAVLRLGRRLDDELADVPRGFAHGDFGWNNVLVDGDRLVGVLDWQSGGDGRLPLLDLFHLELSARGMVAGWIGPAILRQLLPWTRTGDGAAAYCREIGFSIRAGTLEALALAYWLERAALELERYADRSRDPAWIRRNVDDVIDATVLRAG